ncbi:MAG: hypothetical protein HPY76_13710 [Anaerolineae bacterium]|nr:hypothetical protein [Anaerolineae bacterium]
MKLGLLALVMVVFISGLVAVALLYRGKIGAQAWSIYCFDGDHIDREQLSPVVPLHHPSQGGAPL